jgi:hypothetical protein
VIGGAQNKFGRIEIHSNQPSEIQAETGMRLRTKEANLLYATKCDTLLDVEL